MTDQTLPGFTEFEERERQEVAAKLQQGRAFDALDVALEALKVLETDAPIRFKQEAMQKRLHTIQSHIHQTFDAVRDLLDPTFDELDQEVSR